MVPASHGSIGWSENGLRAGHIRRKLPDWWDSNMSQGYSKLEMGEGINVYWPVVMRQELSCLRYTLFHFILMTTQQNQYRHLQLKMRKLTFTDTSGSQTATWKSRVKTQVCLKPIWLFTFWRIRETHWQRHKRERDRERQTESKRHSDRHKREWDRERHTQIMRDQETQRGRQAQRQEYTEKEPWMYLTDLKYNC